jgi:hypothetical protein
MVESVSTADVPSSLADLIDFKEDSEALLDNLLDRRFCMPGRLVVDFLRVGRLMVDLDITVDVVWSGLGGWISYDAPLEILRVGRLMVDVDTTVAVAWPGSGGCISSDSHRES